LASDPLAGDPLAYDDFAKIQLGFFVDLKFEIFASLQLDFIFTPTYFLLCSALIRLVLLRPAEARTGVPFLLQFAFLGCCECFILFCLLYLLALGWLFDLCAR